MKTQADRKVPREFTLVKAGEFYENNTVWAEEYRVTVYLSDNEKYENKTGLPLPGSVIKVREVLEPRPDRDKEIEEAAYWETGTWQSNRSFVRGAEWADAHHANIPGPSEGAGEKCFHGTFKDEYVHGLQARIKALEADISERTQKEINLRADWLEAREELAKLREQLGVVDMSGIDTEGTSEY